MALGSGDDFKKYWQMIYQQQQSAYQNALGGAMLGGLGGIGAVPPPLAEPPKPKTLAEEKLVAAVVGWRRWKVNFWDETLLSINGSVWEPCKKHIRVCKSGGSCAGMYCGCGIYAYKTRLQLEKSENAVIDHQSEIYGEVSLWGKMIECERGFRAQFAYPKRFVNTGMVAEQFAEKFKVPLILM